MKRLVLDASMAAPNFIGAWSLDPDPICDELVAFFEANAGRHRSGAIGGGILPDSKKSTDLTIRPRDLQRDDHAPLRHYFDLLFGCYADYLAQWPFLGELFPSVAIGSFNIQRYLPGEHFARVHCERTTLASLHRTLAWMTYLNDVEEGGATRFTHYGLAVRPRRGQTLIWPADWTHAHAGEVLRSGVKYIVTGWMHLDISTGATPQQGSQE
jgi:prolyl 4-hydroxylase